MKNNKGVVTGFISKYINKEIEPKEEIEPVKSVECLLDIPSIKINDEGIFFILGKYLGVLPKTGIYHTGSGCSRVELNYDNYRDFIEINENDKILISNIWGSFLKDIGWDSNLVYQINRSDDDTFFCLFTNIFDKLESKIIKIIVDQQLSFKIIDSKEAIYSVISSEDNKFLKVTNKQVSEENEKRLIVTKYETTGLKVLIDTDDNVLEITIDYPKELENINVNPYIDEDKINIILNSLTTEIGFDETSENIFTEAIKVKLNQFPLFKISKKDDDVIIQSITFVYGECTEIIKPNMENRITLTSNGELKHEFHGNTFSITPSENKCSLDLSFGRINISDEELLKIIEGLIYDIYGTDINFIQANNEAVEDIRELNKKIGSQ